MDPRPPAFNPNYIGAHPAPGYPAGAGQVYPNPYPNLPAGFNRPVYPDGTPFPSTTYGSTPPPPYSSLSSVIPALPPRYPSGTPSGTPSYPSVNPVYTQPREFVHNLQPYPAFSGTPNMAIVPPAGFVSVMPVLPQTPRYGPASYTNLRTYSPGYVGFVFEPTLAEIKAKKMIVQYNTSADCYVRPKDNSGASNPAGWSSCVFQQQNIYRKVEHDWEKVYLARDIGTDYGCIEWRFDFSRVGRRVACLKISFGTKTYKSGQIQTYAVSDHGVRYEIPSNANSFRIEDASDGWERFSFIAELWGGKDADAWQHAQLFRQPKSIMMNSCPFHVPVRLR